MRIPFVRELSARLTVADLRYWEAYYHIDSGAYHKKLQKKNVGKKMQAVLGKPKKRNR